MMNGKTNLTGMQTIHGLLAMFGVSADGTLPKYRAKGVVTSNRKRPQAVQDFLLQRAKEKRARRAAKKTLQLSTIV